MYSNLDQSDLGKSIVKVSFTHMKQNSLSNSSSSFSSSSNVIKHSVNCWPTPAGRCCHVWLYLPVLCGTCNSPCGPNVDIICVLWEGAPSWYTGKERICVLSDVLFLPTILIFLTLVVDLIVIYSTLMLPSFAGLLARWEWSSKLAEPELVEKLHHVQMLLICLGGMCISCSLECELATVWWIASYWLYQASLEGSIAEGTTTWQSHQFTPLPMLPFVSFLFHVIFLSAL